MTRNADLVKSSRKDSVKRPSSFSDAQGSTEALPDFSHPPAVETLLGLHFKPLPAWNVPQFGLFWHEIKTEYPNVEVHPPLPSDAAIKFEVDPGGVQFRLTSGVPVRCWFIHKSKTRIVQVQNSCFIQNWRKPSEGAPYLHYDELRPSFVEMWGVFCEFLRKNGQDKPSVTDCEVTYINHLDRGREWDRFAELPDITPAWAGLTSGTFLPPPLSVSIDAVYPISGNPGRLEIVLQPGIRKADGKETIQLVLTARCRPQSNQTKELLRCLDLGREWVVRGFTDFTSAKMHDIWGRRERNERPRGKS